MRNAIIAVAVASSLFAAIPDAHACGNSMRNEENLLVAERDQKTLRMAQVAAKKGDHAEALQLAEQALKSQERYVRRRARQIAGTAAVRLERYEKALQHLQVSVKESGNLPVITARLAEAEVGLGRHASALERLEALEKDGLVPDADAYVALARARMSKADKDGARKAVDQALLKDKKHAAALALKDELEEKKQPEKTTPKAARAGA